MFYVYAYLRENGSPYYIGKGKDLRYLGSHTVNIPRDHSRIVFLETNLTNIGALALERRYIRWYGRKDLGTGILRNMTDGGEGSSGRIVSENSRRKQVEARRNGAGYVPSEETRKKISITTSASTLGVKKSKNHSENIAKAKQGEKNPMFGKTPWNKGLKKEIPLKEKGIPGPRPGSISPLRGRPSPLSGTTKETTICPHCNKSGAGGAMNRWHFNNCKKAS